MSNKNIANIEKLELLLIAALAFLLPMFFLPIFPNPFQTPKIILLGAVISLLILIKSTKVILKGSFNFNTGSFDLPVLFLAVAFLASAFFQTPNKSEAFFLPGSASIIFLATLFYILINQLDVKTKKMLTNTLVISAVFSAVITLIATSGSLKNSSLPQFMKFASFNTFGDTLSFIIYSITIVPLAIETTAKNKDVFRKVFWGISTVLISFALIISIFNILPGKSNSITLPSLKNSWIIAIDSLKESPFLGVGPGNYLTAFNRFRPVEYNQTALWNIHFTTARTFYFSLITEGGLLAAAAIVFLFYLISKLALQNNNHEAKLVGWNTHSAPTVLSLIIISILFAVFPADPTNVMLFFILLAINSTSKTIRLSTLSPSEELASKVPVIITTIPVYILAIAILFYGTKSARAEYTYKQALDSINSNNGSSAYTLMQKTINTNPKVDRYHITFAQLNLALANSIASKEKVSDDDKTTISNLVQQSIQSGKNAISLNPPRAQNWEVLAQIYQQISPIAQNAGDFAVQTYSQAINLDPLNPNLRIALGNIYFANKNYDDAVKVLELATIIKPDLPNAHYNLAFAYKENGKLDKAISELTTTLSLVNRDSQDYDTVKKALEDFQSQKKTEAPASDNLTPPQPQERSQNPIELPNNSEPPTPEPSPSPLP